MKINQFAKHTGLSAHTLRYYEKIGLISKVRKNTSGHRDYSRDDFAWIGFLKKLQATGMPIKLMQKFAKLRHLGDASIPERRKLLAEHHQKTLKTINQIKFNLTKIKEKIKHYCKLEK
jgi:DNA-binding transcriptional MerR regulator